MGTSAQERQIFLATFERQRPKNLEREPACTCIKPKWCVAEWLCKQPALKHLHKEMLGQHNVRTGSIHNLCVELPQDHEN